MKHTEYCSLRRLEKEVFAAAARHGYRGDPFDDVPPLGTRIQELAAIDLLHSIPKHIARINLALAHQMCRTVILAKEDAPPAANANGRGKRRDPVNQARRSVIAKRVARRRGQR